MRHTEHTVQTGAGKGYRVRVTHHDDKVIQYEFYIPEAIWNLNSVQTLLDGLHKIAGATVFGGLIGVWQGKQENTRIYRLILRPGQSSPATIRAIIQQEVGRVMADLSDSPQHRQDAFMVTDTEIQLKMADGLTRI